MLNFIEWNTRLKPFFTSELRIIGEIPLSSSDVEEIGAALAEMVRSTDNFGELTRKLHKWPYAFLCLLSGFAANNTNRDYWDSFAKTLNIDKSLLYNQGWHRLFIKLAQKQGLKVFTFDNDPNPYVTSIRYQGGIPAYSLPDYFERMVLPTVQRSSLREISTKEALNYLLDHVNFVDSPVLDFLENSGELGEEFFAESCRLARHALKNNGEILPVEEISLPTYVIKAFESFLEETEHYIQHWRKPELLAAPYDDETAVYLLLSTQEIPLNQSINHIYWQIEYGDDTTPLRISCSVFRQRDTLVTEEIYHPINTTPNIISVSIWAELPKSNKNEQLRHWNLLLLPSIGKTPIVAFRNDQRLFSRSLSLPAELLYLLIPLDAQLEFEGKAHFVEACEELAGAWKHWKMEVWDLTNTWSIQVIQNKQTVGSAIPIQGIITQPVLTGGNLFRFQEEKMPRLYTTNLPSISIPISSTPLAINNLSHWKLHIRSIGHTFPHMDTIIEPINYINQITYEDQQAFFPLSLIFEDQPSGTYEIELHGPRSIHTHLRFRYWPKLLILQLNTGLAQACIEPKSTEFFLKTQENTYCEIQAGAQEVEINKHYIGWQIIAPPTVSKVFLNLVSHTTEGEIIRIPVMIPLPKLQWALSTEQNQGALCFGQQLFQYSIDQFIQMGTASLHIEMYGLDNLYQTLRLRLVEIIETETLILQEAKFNRIDFAKDWLRVGLRQFSDTVKQIHSMAQFELVCFPSNQENAIVRIPLLELNRNLELNQVRFEQVDEISWRVTWYEEYPLCNRRLMIASAWQPWQLPWEYRIPDEARGEFTIQNIAIPPSQYYLYFYISPTFTPTKETPPENINPFRIQLCTPDERIKILSKNGKTPNENFKKFAEIALIHDSLGDSEKRDECLSECAKYIVHLTNVDILIKTLEWMREKEINSSYKKFFLKHLFHPNLVTTLLQTYKKNHPVFMAYIRYTNQVELINSESAKLLLKQVDDPDTTFNCLNQLLNKREEDLIKIVINMISDDRLSIQDAIDLFCSGSDAYWAFQLITQLETNPITDALIAGIFPKIAPSLISQDISKTNEWIIRAIPYEQNEQRIKQYIQSLYEAHHSQVFFTIIRCIQTEALYEDDAIQILSIDPKWAIESLENIPLSSKCQKLLDVLYKQNTSISGIVSIGDKLHTNFGIVTIERIDISENISMNQIKLSANNFIITANTSNDVDKIKLKINFIEHNILIKGINKIWKCGHCSYMDYATNFL